MVETGEDEGKGDEDDMANIESLVVLAAHESHGKHREEREEYVSLRDRLIRDPQLKRNET